VQENGKEKLVICPDKCQNIEPSAGKWKRKISYLP
jgi:hypothetical protein